MDSFYDLLAGRLNKTDVGNTRPMLNVDDRNKCSSNPFLVMSQLRKYTSHMCSTKVAQALRSLIVRVFPIQAKEGARSQ